MSRQIPVPPRRHFPGQGIDEPSPWPRHAAHQKKMSAGHELVYGRQPVLEVLRAGRRNAFRLYVPRDPRPSPELAETVALAQRANLPITKAERSHLNEIVGSVNHQGVAIEVSGYPYVPIEEILESAARPGDDPLLVLILDHLEDPQNLGSLLRTAEAAGVDGVIIPADRAAGVTPAVVRASAGASEHVRVSVVVNLVRAMQGLKDRGLWLTGLEMDPAARPLMEADLKGPVGLVVGGEGRGLSRLVGENCDFRIRIPMRGKVASLNAGVAGAVALYEIRRQRTNSAETRPTEERKPPSAGA